MHWLLLALFAAAPSPLASECESPATRDVSALQTFAQKSGALSVGLDSVATWCFDSGGEFTAGAKGKAPAAPAGDCARSLISCENAKRAVTPELKALLHDALADLDRPFLKKKYVPKRTGLSDRPSDVVDCASRSRPELFAQAQARMDLARLASQAFSEYANYKTWLFAEGLKCSQAAHAGQVDTTQRAMAVDTPAPVASPNPDKSRTVLVQTPAANATSVVVTPLPARDAGMALVAAPAAVGVAVAVVEPPTPMLIVGGPSTERERVLALPPTDRWSALAQVRARLELDRDYTLGFLASRELRDCRCQRPNPTGLSQRYARNDNVSQLEAEETKNEQCEFCLQDAFASWRVRLQKQCALVDSLSEFEVSVLQRSDDGNGLPPRCFEVALSRRDGGTRAGAVLAPTAAKTTTVAAAPALKPVVGGVVPPQPIAMTQTPLADTFSRAQDWAPIPLREDGRLYVRLFMSSACSADVLPGPIQARTGDLLVIPYNARQLSVRSPCGGLAEVYWGREVKPRVSEIFARNQPLHLQFQPQ